jgi:aryl-alcohol dehydrogenase-like predicted oxidoreductase
MKSQSIALGTAQFGLEYGVANQQGKVSADEAHKIVNHALSSGMNTIDTAIAYGDSEECLGRIGMADWRVVSKLPKIPPKTRDIPSWVEECVHGSLQRLRVPQLYGLLLHRPHQLFGHGGNQLYETMNLLKVKGLVNKTGVSIYSPEDLAPIFERFSFDIVQAPFNILDRGLENSGWLSRLHNMGVEVHVRSIFLQGLLLMKPDARPSYFYPWLPLLREWDSWLLASGLTPLQACLGFVLSRSDIGRIVVGVDRLEQLQQILAATIIDSVSPPDQLCCNDPNLINPARWRLV